MARNGNARSLLFLLALGSSSACLATHDASLGALLPEAGSPSDAGPTSTIDAASAPEIGPPVDATSPAMTDDLDAGPMVQLDAGYEAGPGDAAQANDAGGDAGRDAGRTLCEPWEPWECRDP
jgi:hypothetical protein